MAVVTRNYFAVTFLIALFTLNACGALPNYIPNLRRGNGDGDALIEDYFGLGFSYSEVSSLLCWKLSLVGAFPLRSVCVPLINMHNGRVYDVTHCYNLGKKCVTPY